MKNLLPKFSTLMLAVAILWSCGKDDGATPEPEPKNTPPELENQTFEVNENIEPNQGFATVMAEDAEEDTLTFSLIKDESNFFTVSGDGGISLIEGKSLDFETTEEHNLTVRVSDGSSNVSAVITILVQDVNEAPIFDENIQFEVPENIADTFVIGTITATDPENDALTYSTSEDDNGLFEITEDGKLSLAKDQMLDFEAATSHEITVSVTDGEESTLSPVTINVTKVDPENTAPTMEDQSIEVDENIDASIVFATIVAEDAEDDELTFSLTVDESENFTISDNGEISLVEGASLDFETMEEYGLTVQVTDGNSSAEATITISVQNVNEAPIADQESQFDAQEDIDDTVIIGSVTATDPENDVLGYSIAVNDNGLFEINGNGEISLVEGAGLDFETSQEYNITVQLTDGNLSTEAVITISVQDVNEAPIADQESQFDAQEDIDDTTIIGTITATDPESDPLTYSISENDNGLFEINENGEISLAADQMLDYESQTEHTIQVTVADEEFSTTIDVTITVEDVQEIVLADDPASFVTTWETDANEQTIYIGLDPDLVYDFTIDWGDGNIEEIDEIAFLENDNLSHTYDIAGVYTVAINGTFPAMRTEVSYDFGPNLENVDKLISLDQWGTMEWKRMDTMFTWCTNMVYNAEDTPNLSQVETMTSLFSQCHSIGSPDLTDWDVSTVTDMRSLFNNASSFNGDVSTWEVGNVTNMRHMFFQTQFNGDISQWDVSNVTNMSFMFVNNEEFNGDISGWQVDNVTDMRAIFASTLFNGDISEWNVSNVTNMSYMFDDASEFNQDLGGWDITNVDSMKDMFDNSGMSYTNANATLIGWANFVDQNGGPTDITCGMQGVTVCGPEVDAAGLFLVNSNGWFFPGINNMFNCP